MLFKQGFQIVTEESSIPRCGNMNGYQFFFDLFDLYHLRNDIKLLREVEAGLINRRRDKITHRTLGCTRQANLFYSIRETFNSGSGVIGFVNTGLIGSSQAVISNTLSRLFPSRYLRCFASKIDLIKLITDIKLDLNRATFIIRCRIKGCINFFITQKYLI